MAFLTLGPSLMTGHATIDSQHKGLVDAVNQLFEAMQAGKGKDELGHTLAFLRKYTVDHFRTEERFMDQFAYPGAAKHKAIHAELVKKVGDLEARFTSGSGTLSVEVLHFLKEWLAQHISVEDVALGSFLKEKGHR